MQTSAVRHLACSLVLCLLVATATSAQEKPTITPDDYGKWESLGSQAFSPDGRWMTYAINRVNRENELRIHNLEADTVKVVEYGSRAVFSDDSRWLAYSIGYSEKERERMEKQKKPIRNKMGLFDLSTGEETIIEEVSSFVFRDSGGFLAMRRYPIKDRESKGADLVVRDLSTGLDTNFGNVSSFSWQDEGNLLAMIIDAEGKAGNGVQLYDPSTGILRTLDSSNAVYTGLGWREEADDLAILRVREDEGYEDDTHEIIAWRGLSSRRTDKLVYDHTSDENFPAGMRIVDMRPLLWADDGSSIFFGIKEWEKKAEEPEAAEEDTTGTAEPGEQEEKEEAEEEEEEEEEEPADVEIWHARDVDIWPGQKVQANRKRRENFLCVWHLNDGRFLQLGNELTENVNLVEGQKLAVGIDQTPYERDRMFGPRYQDVYVIDVTTGDRTKIKERLEYLYGSSSAGKYLLYLEDDHYYAYDFEKGIHTNITREIPTSFVNLEDDHTVEQKPPFRYAGWTENDRAVLLYDKYDIWEVRPDGSRFQNLTNGADDKIRYRYLRLDREEEFIDLTKPVYLSIWGEWTKQFGFALRRRSREPEELIFLDRNVGRLVKAKEADSYAYIIQDFDDSPDLFVGGPDLKDADQITETNAFQNDYAWGHSELINYENVHGRPLQGALLYPANYIPGRKYPMIVYIYEIVSNSVHRYTTPSERSAYNTTVFTQEGYFVYQPDIVYRDRNPGLSAVECVVPAVQKVLETGMIDPDRIGLVGHSWGAYQTSFIVTQTDLFSAAVAGAPLTDLISMYLSIYWNTGGTDARIFEISQGRMEVPFWEDLEAYMNNSALFNIGDMNTPLLVAFGDEDGAVDWHQGIELYNAARRANKDFVLLVYPGENHSLRKEPNQLDYHRRIIQWFGYYLKDGEPATWITDGVTFLEREKEVERKKK